MIAVVTVRGSLLHGIGTAVWSQGRAALVAILRAIEIFSFAPITGNHSGKKQIILARNPLASQRIIASSSNGTKANLPLSNALVLLCFFVAKLLINWAGSRLLLDETV